MFHYGMVCQHCRRMGSCSAGEGPPAAVFPGRVDPPLAKVSIGGAAESHTGSSGKLHSFAWTSAKNSPRQRAIVTEWKPLHQSSHRRAQQTRVGPSPNLNYKFHSDIKTQTSSPLLDFGLATGPRIQSRPAQCKWSNTFYLQRIPRSSIRPPVAKPGSAPSSRDS